MRHRRNCLTSNRHALTRICSECLGPSPWQVDRQDRLRPKPFCTYICTHHVGVTHPAIGRRYPKPVQLLSSKGTQLKDSKMWMSCASCLLPSSPSLSLPSHNSSVEGLSFLYYYLIIEKKKNSVRTLPRNVVNRFKNEMRFFVWLTIK